MSSTDLILNKQTIVSLFEFLNAFCASQQPFLKHLQQYPLAQHQLNWLQLLDIHSEYLTQENSDYLLKLRLPPQHHCPAPPPLIKEWLGSQWQNWRIDDIHYLEQKTHQPLLSKTTIENFTDNPQRVECWQTWLLQRQQWQQVQQRHQIVRNLFAQLQSIYSELQKQSGSLELVLGSAMLGDATNSAYKHPLIIKPIQLIFNHLANELILEDSSEECELYTDILYELTPQAHLVVNTWREQVQALHPLNEAARLHGQVMQNWLQNQPNNAQLTISYEPVLFVRPRPTGTAQFANNLIKHIDARDINALPFYIKRLAGLINPQQTTFNTSSNQLNNNDILFSLPSNQEQFELAHQLNQHDMVLVQGPPGTGKTHTIANLIGHLLANKQRILITSHSAKALRVLRDKVPASIRSLCVSVLNDDKKSKQELGEAVAALNHYMAQANSLAQQAQQSQQQRQRLLQQQQYLLQQQHLCVSKEYVSIIIGGAATSPSEAARIVNAQKDTHNWLPPFNNNELGKVCPLSVSDVLWLYASQSLILASNEQELKLGLPSLQNLPTPNQWQQLLVQLEQHQQQANTRHKWLWSQLSSVQISRLSESLASAQQLQQQLAHLTQHGAWLNGIIEAGLNHQQNSQIWQELFELIEQSHVLQQQSQSLLLDYQPFLSPEFLNNPQTINTLEEILAYFKTGGRFNWWKMLLNPAWKNMLEVARCNEKTINQQAHIEALIAYVKVEQQQQRLLRRWQRQIQALGGIELAPQNAIKTANDWLSLLQNAFAWAQQGWPHFVKQHLEPCGLSLAQLEQYIAPQTNHATPNLYKLSLLLQQEVIPEWQAHLAKHSAEQVATLIGYHQQQLQPYLAQRAPDSVLYQLVNALQHHEAQAYQQAYEQLQGLQALQADYQQRIKLLDILTTGAKAWAQAIQQRQTPHQNHTPPHTDIYSAWQWRQFYDELQHRQQLDLDHINRQLQQNTQDLQRTTADLISQQTWAHQVIAAEPYRPHLVGWQQTQTRIGKGTGKLAPELRLQAQKQLKLAQYAVPVWIMPLTDVFRSFEASTQFDVVIIDEASQVDIKGLLATYLGKKVVIVGDDEQVSPDAVGADSNITQRLQQEHLTTIPNYHLYDGQTSLYDLTKQVARGQLCLREHFRCVPAIIGFSNQLSYQGQIKALREPASSHLMSHVVPYRVQGGQRMGKINEQEAESIAFLIEAMCQHPAYNNKTIGVISLLGNEQATLIETKLRQKLLLSTIEERRLLCGNSAQFQGDERDVVLLSMVDSNEGDGVMRLRSDGARDMNKKRYNVAASRAKDQLWVVHSVDYQTDLKPDDLRTQLLAYCYQHSLDANNALAQHHTESPFEAAVLKQLLARGYEVSTQYEVGYYRIDMVVQGSTTRLAIECDGDRYHSGSEKIAEDLARQAILERLGWQFYRVRGSAFFANPQSALDSLWQRLTELDILPIEQNQNNDIDNLHQEIIQLAQQLQQDYLKEDEEVTPNTEPQANYSRINELFKQRSEHRRLQK